MVTGFNGFCQRCLVDQAAAGGVDDDLALLRLRQQLCVEHAGGFFGLRQVDGHEICACHQLIQFHEFHTKLGSTSRVGIRVIGNDLGFECSKALREKLTDVTKSDDADGLVEDFYALKRRTLPFAIAQSFIRGRNLPCGSHQQRNSLLTCRVNIRGRSIGDHDTTFGSRFNVDVVQANTGTANDAQVRCCLEHFLVDGGCRTHQQGVGLADCTEQFFAVGAVNPPNFDGVAQGIHRGLG